MMRIIFCTNPKLWFKCSIFKFSIWINKKSSKTI